MDNYCIWNISYNNYCDIRYLLHDRLSVTGSALFQYKHIIVKRCQLVVKSEIQFRKCCLRMGHLGVSKPDVPS